MDLTREYSFARNEIQDLQRAIEQRALVPALLHLASLARTNDLLPHGLPLDVSMRWWECAGKVEGMCVCVALGRLLAL